MGAGTPEIDAVGDRGPWWGARRLWLPGTQLMEPRPNLSVVERQAPLREVLFVLFAGGAPREAQAAPMRIGARAPPVTDFMFVQAQPPPSLNVGERDYEHDANAQLRKDLFESIGPLVNELRDNSPPFAAALAMMQGANPQALRDIWTLINQQPQFTQRIAIPSRGGRNVQQPLMRGDNRDVLNPAPRFDQHGPARIAEEMALRCAHRMLNKMMYDIHEGDERIRLNVGGGGTQAELAKKFIHNSQRAYWNPQLLGFARDAYAELAVRRAADVIVAAVQRYRARQRR